ncbi:hypothetical protein [Dictyobacter kobayashii]|uniref:hypothetical protein n=1 Tax=Dictyobacter kobayashii TaxID=2014872 RepID=UPI000F820378|nr:hypothetical protein [Dictyobacter kobayashii]
MKSKSFTYTWPIMCTLLLMIFVLAACGANQTSDQSQSSTKTSTPTVQATQSGSAQTATPGATQGYCGSISQMLQRSSASTGKSDPQQVGNCFWNAYQTCTPASLNYVVGSVDTVTTRTFLIQKTGSGCLVQDKLQMRVIPRPPQKSQLYTCSAIKMQATALQVLNCQTDGTITLSLMKK